MSTPTRPADNVEDLQFEGDESDEYDDDIEGEEEEGAVRQEDYSVDEEDEEDEEEEPAGTGLTALLLGGQNGPAHVEEEEEEEEEDGEYADNAFAPAPAVTPTNETVKKRSIDEVNDDGAPQGAAEDGTAVRNGDAKKAKV